MEDDNSTNQDSLSIWRPPIASVEKVDKEAYKIIFDEAKERFEECASESEAITERSIKMLFGVAAVGAFCINRFLVKPPTMTNIVLLSVSMVVESVMLIILIGPRKVYYRGQEPKIAFPKELDIEARIEQVGVVYYELLRTYQVSIDNFYLILKGRGRLYKCSIFLGLGILVYVGVLISLTLISHP
jgi:hypothetical protein